MIKKFRIKLIQPYQIVNISEDLDRRNIQSLKNFVALQLYVIALYFRDWFGTPSCDGLIMFLSFKIIVNDLHREDHSRYASNLFHEFWNITVNKISMPW